MRRLAVVLLVFAFIATALGDTISQSVAQLTSAVGARVTALQALPKLNKLQKKELKKLEEVAEQLTFFPDTGLLRDLIFLAGVGKPLKASGTRDAGIQGAVVAVANCMLVFVQNEQQEAAAARLLLQDPAFQQKIDKSLTKANKAFQTTQQLFNTNPAAAVAALMEAAVEYRKIQKKVQELLLEEQM